MRVPLLPVATALVLAGVALVGCSSGMTESASPAECGESACIGLVVQAGSIDDGAFYSAAWSGVQQAGSSSGAVVDYLESADPQDYQSNLEAFAEAGYDVVVTTGVDVPDVTQTVAREFPDTRFIGISQDMTDGPANSTGLVFSDDQAGFAAGYLAGLMTKTGVVGAVLGSETVVPLRRFGEGFRLGVLSSRPDATVLMDYNPNTANSFNDPEWGGSTARRQLAQDADVVFGAGGTTGIGALLAVAEDPRAGSDVFCIGIDVDQYETVPEARPCLITSAEKRIADSVADAATRALQGEQLPQNIDGSISLAPYHDLQSRVPSDVTARVNTVIEGLRSGALTTGVDF